MWHLPTLKPEIKQHLLSASANALKLVQRYPDCIKINQYTQKGKQSPPERQLIFKHAVLLHKRFNAQSPNLEWADLHFKQKFGLRQTTFTLIK